VVSSIDSVVAVIDTGADPKRLPTDRLILGVNLSREGPEHDTTDAHGHGTAISSGIFLCSAHAVVMPVKLLGAHGYLREADQLEVAFEWILERCEALGVAVVCAPFADANNLTTDERFRGTRLQLSIAALREAGVATVAPAGNVPFWDGTPGMAWPAILREVVSVGAVERTPAGLRLSGHTQRLPAGLGTGCATTVFAEPKGLGGTSGAAAAVAARLADLRSEHPTASVDALVERLLEAGHAARDGSRATWPILERDSE
jgi:subtilisin family serine protease